MIRDIVRKRGNRLEDNPKKKKARPTPPKKCNTLSKKRSLMWVASGPKILPAKTKLMKIKAHIYDDMSVKYMCFSLINQKLPLFPAILDRLRSID